MSTLSGQTALVTGASAGLGLELAKLCAAAGANLVLVARTAERLQALARELTQQHAVAVRVMPKDLGLPAMPKAIYEELRAAGVTIDILVNNAGVGVFGLFADTEFQAQARMVQLNVTAVLELTHLFLRDMVHRGRGRILNVSSTAAYQPGPLLAGYYASKAYVSSLSEALANEVRGTGVTVSVLCPGPTHTEFHARAAMGDTALFRILRFMDAQTVARVGFRGMLAGKAVIIPGLLNRVGAVLAQLAPRAWTTRVVRYAQTMTRKPESGASGR